VILGGFGEDVRFVDRALEHAFKRFNVDPHHVAIEGFSDGASYALSLGITNGDLFGEVMAFSPGFAAPGPSRGRPRFFITHGTEDRVLPIDVTSRKVAPRLERAGYDVRYEEFVGGHTPNPDLVQDAVDWFLHERR